MLQLDLNGFLMNAGILGFLRLLEFLKAEEGIDYQIEDCSLLISPDYLKSIDLAEAYVKMASVAYYDRSIYPQWESIFKMIRVETKKFLEGDEAAKTEKDLLKLYARIVGNESMLKASKNFEKAYPYLKNKCEIDLKELITAVNKEKDWAKKLLLLNELELALQQEDVKKHLLIVSIADRVLSRFWIKGFLATATGKTYVKSGEDMVALFKKSSTMALESYLDNPSAFDSKGSRVCTECGSCHVTSKASTLSFLNDIADDAKRKASAFWDFNNGSVQLCELCAFTYLLIPFGFTLIGNRALFVNDCSSLKTLAAVNQVNGLKPTNLNELSFKFYNQLIQAYLKAEVVQLNNVQLVTRLLDKEAQRYQFDILSRDTLRLIKSASGSLEKLTKCSSVEVVDQRLNPYEETVLNILNHQNQYFLIQKLCKLALDEKLANRLMYALAYIWPIQQKKRAIQIESNQGGLSMTLEEYQAAVDGAMYDGRRLNGFFYANNKNKDGVLCRLLNALQAKNQDEFLQTMIRLHGVNGIPLSPYFVQAIGDGDLFTDMAHAYLLGFQGVYSLKDKEGVVTDGE